MKLPTSTARRDGVLLRLASAFIGSGGGISQYETEPAYQRGVQSTGGRTTPDVSLVADPGTGAWIADPYNLDPAHSFEVVGGTSLSAPAWAGLLAITNQGRVATGRATLNHSSPNETQQALYMLPQTDYHSTTSGFNGYNANAGYNLVTGLGTPVADHLVSDLVAYDGPDTSYSGPTVGQLQDTTYTDTGYEWFRRCGQRDERVQFLHDHEPRVRSCPRPEHQSLHQVGEVPYNGTSAAGSGCRRRADRQQRRRGRPGPDPLHVESDGQRLLQ